MFAAEQYELIDFGEARKLERFSQYTIDRPCPSAERQSRASPEPWPAADARFVRTGPQSGRWSLKRPFDAKWRVRHEPLLQFELTLTDFGHLGVFPEQAANWDWLWQRLQASGRPLKILNLFGYTGGSTLAAAAAGAQVVHVDAAKNVVAWARRNARASGLAEAPIRWITEDARKFVARELRRKNRYDAVILDPPSYGHGPKREVWQIDKHLAELLTACFALTGGCCNFILLTCHSPQFSSEDLNLLLQAAAHGRRGSVETEQLVLRSTAGRKLPHGLVARWMEP